MTYHYVIRDPGSTSQTYYGYAEKRQLDLSQIIRDQDPESVPSVRLLESKGRVPSGPTRDKQLKGLGADSSTWSHENHTTCTFTKFTSSNISPYIDENIEIKFMLHATESILKNQYSPLFTLYMTLNLFRGYHASAMLESG